MDDLPTATQVGVAETAAELARYPDHHSWARPLLARLLEHESEDIHTMASRWTYTVTQPDQQSDVAGDRTPIPARFLELIPATVRRMTKLMDAYPLLLALAGGTATQARNACRVTAELLPGSLPSSDLAFGWDVTRCAQIAQAAYETLDNEAVDPSPAMDLLDQLVGHNPCALMGDLLARR